MTDWASKIRQGDARALARAATAVENRDPRGAATLDELAPFAGRARVIGITGPPGAGKSTLVDALAAALRGRGQTVAIVAVDPTSRVSGGAILGDRIRMQQHHADPGIFIRSVATRGASGGVARATADLVRLMDCAGKDWVLIETVGVGQDEIDIAALAQVTVVVLVPGMGDDVQAIKAGIMEIADVFVVNKSDLPGADRLEREILAERDDAPVVKTVATEGKGIDELLEAVGQASERNPPLPQGRGSEGPRSRDREGAEGSIDSGGFKLKAEIGIIGGSGLYSMPGFEAQEEALIETPFGAPSDNYVLGKLAGRRVAFLARHGRGHRLSPSEVNFRANIYGMKSLGVERILSLSAVGSLKEEHRPLDFVIPDQFFDRTRGRASTFFGEGLVAHVGFSDPVCPELAGIAAEACRAAGVNCS